MLVPRIRRAPGPQAVLLGPRLVIAPQPRGEAGDQGRHKDTCHVPRVIRYFELAKKGLNWIQVLTGLVTAGTAAD